MEFQSFKRFKNLAYGLSEIVDGDMRIAGGLDSLGAKNRRHFFKKINIDERGVVCALLVHGSNVETVTDKQRGTVVENVDGLITRTPGLFLALTIADCVPVFLFDPTKNAIGLIHAGWRGIAAGIIPKSILLMGSSFGCLASDLVVALGPGIRQCHYPVGKEVADIFSSLPNSSLSNQSDYRLDLHGIITAQAVQSGILDSNVEVSPVCTFEDKDKYFSFRRDGKKNFGVMMAYFGLK